jgi:hypothetical protein
MPIYLLQGTRFKLKYNKKDAIIISICKSFISPLPIFWIMDEDGKEGAIRYDDIDWTTVSKEDLNKACGIKPPNKASTKHKKE